MTSKINREIEKGMTNALLGLIELRQQQEDRQNKKHWSSIDVPFTLYQGLSHYSKNELDKIRKSLDLKGASSLKKTELIGLLAEKIPALLETVCEQFDEERFSLLTKIANNGGFMKAPHLETSQIEYFRANGLIYTGIHNGKKILALPEELIEPVKFLDKNSRLKSLISRNTQWIKLTSGLLYYYGTLSIHELVELLEFYLKEQLDIRAYLDVIFNGGPEHKGISVGKEGLSNIRVIDPISVKQEHQMRKDVPFYPFTKEQLLAAGEPGFIDRNIGYAQLVNFLAKNYQMNRAEADSIVEEIVYATRIDDNPNHIMRYFSEILVFNSIEEAQALMDNVVILMNNTRKWFLKGYTSIELRKQSEKASLPISIKSTSQSHGNIDEKVGRNDPCPCGSNKKYKKCCGR